MTDLSKYPERVGRAVAMELLCIRNRHVFKRVIDETPDLAHKLPGEKRAKYRTAVIGRLLAEGVRPGGSPKSEVQSLKSKGSGAKATGQIESRTR